MDALTLTVVGAAYGGGIAMRLCLRPAAESSIADRRLSLLFLCLAIGSLAIVFQHRFDAWADLGAVLERIEYGVGLSVGPLLWLYVRSVQGGGSKASDRWHFLPGLGALILPRLHGDPLLGLPIELLMLHQFAYTATAIARYRAAPIPAGHRHRPWCRCVLGFMVGIHGAQLVRLVAHDLDSLRNIVPVSLALAALGFGLLAVRSGVGGRRRSGSAALPGRREPPSDPRCWDQQLLDRLHRLMAEESAYRDPGLGLPALAARVGTTPHELSRVLNQVSGVSLTDFLNELRVEDAKRRLLDPGHDCFSIEGIAAQSGFGSRSAFYAALRRLGEVAPSELRRRSELMAPERSPSRYRRPDRPA